MPRLLHAVFGMEKFGIGLFHGLDLFGLKTHVSFKG